jgi:hypothetical protein
MAWGYEDNEPHARSELAHRLRTWHGDAEISLRRELRHTSPPSPPRASTEQHRAPPQRRLLRCANGFVLRRARVGFELALQCHRIILPQHRTYSWNVEVVVWLSALSACAAGLEPVHAQTGKLRALLLILHDCIIWEALFSLPSGWRSAALGALGSHYRTQELLVELARTLYLTMKERNRLEATGYAVEGQEAQAIASHDWSARRFQGEAWYAMHIGRPPLSRLNISYHESPSYSPLSPVYSPSDDGAIEEVELQPPALPVDDGWEAQEDAANGLFIPLYGPYRVIARWLGTSAHRMRVTDMSDEWVQNVRPRWEHELKGLLNGSARGNQHLDRLVNSALLFFDHMNHQPVELAEAGLGQPWGQPPQPGMTLRNSWRSEISNLWLDVRELEVLVHELHHSLPRSDAGPWNPPWEQLPPWAASPLPDPPTSPLPRPSPQHWPELGDTATPAGPSPPPSPPGTPPPGSPPSGSLPGARSGG